MKIDYSKTCFVIMPFGVKTLGAVTVDFDFIYQTIFEPAISAVTLPEGGGLQAVRTDRDFFAGDIGEEMFQYLNESRFAVADITGLNANVMYEIGVRHAARAAGTAIFRQVDAPIPFDLGNIKAFPYQYRTEADAEEARMLIRRVIGESLAQNTLDSPVQRALAAQRDGLKSDPVQQLLRDAENDLRRFDHRGAIAKLKGALAIGGDNPLIHVRLGILLRDDGNPGEALEHFTTATKIQPDYSDAWREQGILEGRLDNNTQAEDSLRKAISHNPNDFDALASLGGILRKTDRLQEAGELYQRAADVSGGHPYPLLMALKMRARTTGKLDIDPAVRMQLSRARKMREAQANANPPFDAPWCMFDLAEMQLYLNQPQGFLEWTKRGLAACDRRYQPQTFRSALQLLVDGGIDLPGFRDAIPLIEGRIAELHPEMLLPAGSWQAEFAYRAVLEQPARYELLDSLDPATLREAIWAIVGDAVTKPDEILAPLRSKDPSSPNRLWIAWLETVHATKLQQH